MHMAASLLAVLLAGAAAGAGALAPALGTPSHRSAAAEAGQCSCLVWKEVYTHAGVHCGSTNEFRGQLNLSAVGSMAPLLRNLLGGQFCQNFYETLDENFCVNLNTGADEGQWCFVPSHCSQLRGGDSVPSSQVQWKKCGAGDRGLRSKMPEQLAALASSEDLDLAVLHKMSYPLDSHCWGEVQAVWGEGDIETVRQPLRDQMLQIKASGLPHSFDTEQNHQPPHRIVMGPKVYEVAGAASADTHHPGTWMELRCLRGCD